MSDTITITLADGRVQKVRKLTLARTQDGVQIVGYFIYWFVGKDKTTDDHFERIFLTSWDRIVHRVLESEPVLSHLIGGKAF
jgi:hypothetical protein